MLALGSESIVYIWLDLQQMCSKREQANIALLRSHTYYIVRKSLEYGMGCYTTICANHIATHLWLADVMVCSANDIPANSWTQESIGRWVVLRYIFDISYYIAFYKRGTPSPWLTRIWFTRISLTHIFKKFPFLT